MHKLILIGLLGICFIFMSAKAVAGDDCANFSGVWIGTCEGTEKIGEENPLVVETFADRITEIKQTGCEKIEMRSVNYDDSLAEAKKELKASEFEKYTVGVENKFPAFMVDEDFEIKTGKVTLEWKDKNQTLAMATLVTAEAKPLAKLKEPDNENLRQRFDVKETFALKEGKLVIRAKDLMHNDSLVNGKWELDVQSLAEDVCTLEKAK